MEFTLSCTMVIIAKTVINIFAHKHLASKAALNSWYQIVREVDCHD